MLKAYLRVIHASLILTDMHGYHAQLSMVTSDMDMISVIFIRGKLLKLHASVSIHTTGVLLHLEAFPSATFSVNRSCLEAFPSATFL